MGPTIDSHTRTRRGTQPQGPADSIAHELGMATSCNDPTGTPNAKLTYRWTPLGGRRLGGASGSAPEWLE